MIDICANIHQLKICFAAKMNLFHTKNAFLPYNNVFMQQCIAYNQITAVLKTCTMLIMITVLAGIFLKLVVAGRSRINRGAAGAPKFTKAKEIINTFILHSYNVCIVVIDK